MKRKLTRLLMISCALAMLAGSLNSGAQEKKDRLNDVSAEFVLQRDHFRIIGSKSDFGKVVKGAPYSATVVTEHIQTLSDGNQIIRKNESKLYRDSEGRTRKEQTLDTIGKWTAGGEVEQLTYIDDPVAKVRYSLDPRTRAAYRDDALRISFVKVLRPHILLPLRVGEENKNEKIEDVTVVVAPSDPAKNERMKNTQILKKKMSYSVAIDGAPPPGKEEWKTEALGKEVIEGVEVEHTRKTLTIPAGEIGNTLPIEVVDETWYSPELQIMIMTRHRDPREGETTYRLSNISRSEPDRSLFEVPTDYGIRTKKFPPAKKRRPLSSPEEKR